MNQATWYHSLGGQQNGPVLESEIQQLVSTGQLKADDKVWQVGMEDWLSVEDVPLLKPLIPAPSQPPAGTPLGGVSGNPTSAAAVPSPYASPQSPVPHAPLHSPWQGQNLGPMPPTYLWQSIVLTIFNFVMCCGFPIGIVAIVFAAQVTSRYNEGNYPAALSASNNAKIWCIVSLVLMVLPILFIILSVLAEA